MHTMSLDLADELSEARRQVETHCQALVDAGMAQWRGNEDGGTELHLDNGEIYLFGDLGVKRLK